MVRNVSFPRNEGKDFQYMKRKSSILTRIEINQQNRLMKFPSLLNFLRLCFLTRGIKLNQYLILNF